MSRVKRRSPFQHAAGYAAYARGTAPVRHHAHYGGEIDGKMVCGVCTYPIVASKQFTPEYIARLIEQHKSDIKAMLR